MMQIYINLIMGKNGGVFFIYENVIFHKTVILGGYN